MSAPHTIWNAPRTVLCASMIGTIIEFFDFYIYATAAALLPTGRHRFSPA